MKSRFLLAFCLLLPALASAQVRITTASTSYTDSQGNAWSPDTSCASGGNKTVATTAISGALPGPSDAALYQPERWGTFSESCSVPNGTYQVTLKMAETYWTAAGKRVFSATINGAPALTNFDIFAAANGPNKAVDKIFPVTVTTGNVTISFTATVDNAKVDSISILPASTPPTPPFISSTSFSSSVSLSCSTAPAAPTPHSVTLYWTASPTAGVSGYNVYRSTTSGTAYVKIATVAATALTYSDATVVSSATYFYVVTATMGSQESGYSNQVGASIP